VDWYKNCFNLYTTTVSLHETPLKDGFVFLVEDIRDYNVKTLKKYFIDHIDEIATIEFIDEQIVVSVPFDYDLTPWELIELQLEGLFYQYAQTYFPPDTLAETTDPFYSLDTDKRFCITIEIEEDCIPLVRTIHHLEFHSIFEKYELLTKSPNIVLYDKDGLFIRLIPTHNSEAELAELERRERARRRNLSYRKKKELKEET